MWPALEIAPRSILSVIKALKSAAGWISQIYSALHKFRGLFTTALAAFAFLRSLLDGASQGDAAGSAGRFSFRAFFFHFILFSKRKRSRSAAPRPHSAAPLGGTRSSLCFAPLPALLRRPARAGPGGAGRGPPRSRPGLPRRGPDSLSRCWRPRNTSAGAGDKSRPAGCPDGGAAALTAHGRAATLCFPRVGCLAPRAGTTRGYSCAEGQRPCAGCARGASRLRRGPAPRSAAGSGPAQTPRCGCPLLHPWVLWRT